MSGYTSVPFRVFHSELRRGATSYLHNHLVSGSVEYDYAESGDVCFNDARRDLWRFLTTGMATVEVCKIDSIGVRPIMCREGRN